MKKIISILALALTLSWVSCTPEGLDTIHEINDHFSVPEGTVELTSLTQSESTWSLDRRYFDLSFTGNGGSLDTRLVGYDALLTPGQYVLGGDEIGKAVFANTKINGQPAKEGFITVTQSKGKYIITAQIDGKVLTWTGDLPFVADPAPMTLSVVQQAQANKDNKLVTMQLATEGFSQGFDENWQTVWTGEGAYLAIDLYSEDGYLHDGAYRACAEGGVVNAGEFGIGYDTTVDWGWGPMEMKDWGTCLWTVANGSATAEKITEGLLTVSSREETVDDKDVTIWTIFWGLDYPVEILFEGAIPALTKPKPVGPVSFDYTYTIGDPADCSTQAGEVVSGVKKYPFTISNADGEEVAYLEFILTEGAADVEPGDYVSTEYAHEAGQLANGYSIDFGEWGTFSGGSWYLNGDGDKVFIDPGVTVSVEAVGTGAFKFSSDAFEFAAAGPNYVPGGDDVGDALPAKDVVSEQGAGVDKHSITIGEGDNIVAYFELLTATGADFVGSFVSTEYAAEPGMLCNGYSFPDWGIFGGSYIMVDGARQDVAPGATVEVTNVSGNVYKFVCSTGETFVADVTK